ncbi:MAG: hypothetical protein ACK5OB_04170 [Pirellula sp.]
MTRLHRTFLTIWSALFLIAPALAQSPTIWKGQWLEQDDSSFAFASADATLPGIRFQWTQSPTQTYFGQVFNSHGKPAANAEVWFSGIFGRIPVRERTRTRADGKFKIDLPSVEQLGTVRWVVTAFQDNECSRSLRDPNPQGFELHLEPGRNLQLSVFEAKPANAADPSIILNTQLPDTDRPIEHFTVHTQDGRILRSDAPGTCVVQGLAPTIQYLGVSAPGHAFRYVMVDLFEDRDYAFSFSLSQGGIVRGHVRDPEEQPVPWNSVTSQTCESAILTLGRSFTIEDGSYALGGLRIDRKSMVSAFSHGDEGTTFSQDALVDFQGTRAATSDFEVTPKHREPPQGLAKMAALVPAKKPLTAAVLRGRAVLPDGSPCRDFTLRVQSTTSGRRQSGFAASYGSIGIRFTSEGGHFLFSGLSLGSSYRLLLSTPGYRDVVVDPVEPMPDEDAQDADPVLFEFEPTSEVRLAVVDTQGAPVPNATVRLFRTAPGDYLSHLYKDRFLYQGITDANGKLVFSEITLLEGQWMIESPTFPLHKFSWNGERDVAAALQSPVSLRLRFQFDSDITDPMTAILTAQSGEILHYQEGFSASNSEWKLEGLLPGTYHLSISSSNGKSRLVFDETGQRTSQVLNAEDPDVSSYEFSFDIATRDPSP